VHIVKLFQTLPKSEEARILGKPLLRSATSVGATDRAVCRARSKPEIIAMMGVVVEEADKTDYGLEMLEDSGILDKSARSGLLVEANELLALFAASLRTARQSDTRGE